MDLKISSTALFVKNIEKSKYFYTNILNLSIDLDFGKNIIFKSGFAIWEINDSHIITTSIGQDKIKDSSVNRFELYFETENLQAVYDSLKENNVKFLHGVHEEPWGQYTIRFFDPDNHLIEVGESMKQFTNRLYKQGMTLEQVSARTHVALEDLKRFIE
jgi:catechol 2,3-dioxygenase-like lactoylglutathione lyase family enzyme